MKKAFSLFLTFIFILSVFTITSSAAKEVQLSINDVTVSAGENFTVDVMISDNADLSGAVINIKYDSSLLQFVEGTVGGIVSETAQTDIRNISSDSTVRFTYMDAGESITSSGILFTIEFLALDNAKGDTPLEIQIDNPGDFVSSESEKIPYTLNSAKVTIKNYNAVETTSEAETESETEESVSSVTSISTTKAETKSETVDESKDDSNNLRIIVTIVCTCLVLVLLILLISVIYKSKKRGNK